MGAQGLIVTCLGLLLGQPASDIVHLNRRVVQIPLTFEASRRGEIREILLFASPDQGKNWQQVAAATPDKEFISFTAPADGVYWLGVAAVNRFGKQEPENIRALPPAQKLVIDTLRPLVRITEAGRIGDEVQIGWELREDAPDWTSFRIEWQMKDGGSPLWNTASAAPAFTGKTKFRPGTNAALNIRLTLKDLAGNVSTVAAELSGEGVIAVGGVAPPPASTTPLIPAGSFPPPVAESRPFLPPPTGMAPVPPPAFPPVSVGKPDSNPWTPPPGAKPAADSVPIRPVAFTAQEPSAPPVPAAPPRRALPPIQYHSRPMVPLEYELSKVGPSGIGSVDLYWTRNEGQSWEKYADDPAVEGMTKTGRFQRLIELPGDGVYGFTLVVTSRAGRGQTPPNNGDVPQMLVEIDSAAPVAQLFPPVPDTSRPNTLLLRWQAKDKNPTDNPISLEWAERREGPWQPIGLNLANTGQHPWSLPEKMPVAVFLRLRVRDQAGNESVAVTSEPQLVDLSVPEGRLLGISTPRP